MKTELIKIKDLKHYKLNAKRHPPEQIEGLCEAIRRFGFIQPIVIDSKNEIIIGHGRHMAATKLGLEEVPCVRMENLTEAEVRTLRLFDNRISETGWDNEILIEELSTLDADFSELKVDFSELIDLSDLADDDLVEKETQDTDYKLTLLFNEKSKFELAKQKLQKEGYLIK